MTRLSVAINTNLQQVRNGLLTGATCMYAIAAKVAYSSGIFITSKPIEPIIQADFELI